MKGDLKGNEHDRMLHGKYTFRPTLSFEVNRVINSLCLISLSAEKLLNVTNWRLAVSLQVVGAHFESFFQQVFISEPLIVKNSHRAFFVHLPRLPSLSPSPSGVHVFGLLATALVTDVIQLATGYHSPFFLTVCQPNYTAPGVSCDNNAYITRDICLGKDQYAIMSAR